MEIVVRADERHHTSVRKPRIEVQHFISPMLVEFRQQSSFFPVTLVFTDMAISERHVGRSQIRKTLDRFDSEHQVVKRGNLLTRCRRHLPTSTRCYTPSK
jgi:hypothetical protein